MLIAATIVARMLNRNRKIVRIAKMAPEAALADEAVARLLDEHGQVGDGRDRHLVRVARAWISASLAWTASATSTVFAFDVLDTVRVSAWLPLVRP